MPLLLLLIPPETPTADLAVTFLGATNNPTRSLRPVRLEMLQGTTGLCAIFEIKSLATNHFVQFKQEAIAQREHGEWATSSRPTQFGARLEGLRWSPGYSCLYAIPWPAELPTNTSWRAVVSVQRETGGIRLWVNTLLGRELFDLPAYGEHTIYSTEVDAAVPFVMPQ